MKSYFFIKKMKLILKILASLIVSCSTSQLAFAARDYSDAINQVDSLLKAKHPRFKGGCSTFAGMPIYYASKEIVLLITVAATFGG